MELNQAFYIWLGLALLQPLNYPRMSRLPLNLVRLLYIFEDDILGSFYVLKCHAVLLVNGGSIRFGIDGLEFIVGEIKVITRLGRITNNKWCLGES